MNISGDIFKNMIISAANHLGNNKDENDRLNVFPVPDGDTGKNMYLTMAGAAAALGNTGREDALAVCEKVALSTLKSARGNSGVILSQLFRGLSKGLAEHGTITPESWAAGLLRASETAYNAVMKPTEGTILTVARECAAAAAVSAKTAGDVKTVMKDAVKGARISLDKTPDLLPKLKEAGVVDAGGMGWLCILEGMYAVMETGEIIESRSKDEPGTAAAPVSSAGEEIRFGYCTEFIIEKSGPVYPIEDFRNAIGVLGDSMLVIDDYDVVKVHIHTDNPGIALQEGLKLGSLLNIKVDNMRHQHNENIQPAAPVLKEHAIIAVSAGQGFSEIFKELGVSATIEGGQTMNPSAGDILEAVRKQNAKTVYVLPNNKNIILAANQAKEMAECAVYVIPCASVPEGVAAAIAFNPMSSAADNEQAMVDAVKSVKTGLVTYAVRDSESNGLVIREGDIIGLSGGSIVTAGDSLSGSVKNVCELLCDEDTSMLTLYYGSDTSEEDARRLAGELEGMFPDCDISLHSGGQPVYYYIISAE